MRLLGDSCLPSALPWEWSGRKEENISDCTITINTTDDGACHALLLCFPSSPSCLLPRPASFEPLLTHTPRSRCVHPAFRNKTTPLRVWNLESTLSNSVPFSLLFSFFPCSPKGMWMLQWICLGHQKVSCAACASNHVIPHGRRCRCTLPLFFPSLLFVLLPPILSFSPFLLYYLSPTRPRCARARSLALFFSISDSLPSIPLLLILFSSLFPSALPPTPTSNTIATGAAHDRRNPVTDDGLIAMAKRFRSFNMLDVEGANDLSDVGVTSFVKGQALPLERVNLSFCTKLTDESVKAVAEGCPGLRELSLRQCYQVTDHGIEALARGCRGLRTLQLEHCSTISDYAIVTVARQCRQLEYLGLEHCSHITDASAIALGTHCPNLFVIRLDVCYNITRAGIEVSEMTFQARLHARERTHSCTACAAASRRNPPPPPLPTCTLSDDGESLRLTKSCIPYFPVHFHHAYISQF